MACIECGALLVREISPAIWYGSDGKVYVEEIGLCDKCAA